MLVQMLMKLVVALSWLAIPVTILCVVDDWFLRPKRQLAAAPQPAADPVLLKICYGALPFLIGAGVLRLLFADRLDFSAVLVLITAVTGIVWWLDAMIFAKQRAAAAAPPARSSPPSRCPAPWITLAASSRSPRWCWILRAFIFEPFRIPSDSMMPTLLSGDFIIVNKYAYGLRLPVLNHKFVSVGEPERGDVVVFRYPLDPSINYIKRLVGLPGDRVVVKDDRIYVNEQPIQFDVTGGFDDGCYINMREAAEHLGDHVHRTIFCPGPIESPPMALPSCTRRTMTGYICSDRRTPGYGELYGEPEIAGHGGAGRGVPDDRRQPRQQ